MNQILAHDSPCGARHPHTVQLYQDDTALVRDVSDFLCTTLTAGAPAIVIGTPEHRERIGATLAAAGFGVARAREQGRYVALDAAETMALFMDGDRVDVPRFAAVIGDQIQRAAATTRSPRLRTGVYGEMVSLLARERRFGAALELERHWNALTHRHRFSLLCSYPASAFARPEDTSTLFDICDQHTDVVATGRLPGQWPASADVAQEHLLDDDAAHGTTAARPVTHSPTDGLPQPPTAAVIARSLRTLVDRHGLPLVLQVHGDRIIAVSRRDPGFELEIRAGTFPVNVSYRGWLPEWTGSGEDPWRPLWRLLRLWGTGPAQFRPAADRSSYPNLLDHLL